ncbi:EAL domain-containing protein [Henriciella aquimarina]|uniref:EAL domain-containing protein n=1 Tax=Henriciella aquimarina TaxID=545261 RepID=UPI0009FBE304|nr:EAL domain-containing protein [Henriciella aquimarina]
MICAAIEIERAPVIGPDEPCRVADEIFRNLPLVRCIVVVSDEMKPIGLVPRSEFLLQLSQRFGRALYENRPIRHVMLTGLLSVPESCEFDDFVRTSFMSSEQDLNDCFVLTDDEGHYRGISTGRAVMSALLDRQGGLLQDLSRSQTQLVEANERLGKEVHERRLAEEEAVRASNRDPLTGLSNRAPFVKAISKRINTGVPFSLIFIDLDGFKTLNDVYGHLAGDEALKTVAARIQSTGGPAVCARFGGDEFAIVLDGEHDEAGDWDIAQSLHERVTEGFVYDNITLRAGASVGLARFPDHASEPSGVLQAADMAMLRAKREGGGVRIYDHTLDANSRSTRSQLNELTAAIQSKALIPFFQPVFDLGSMQPVVYEVLARWPGAEMPLGRPDHFIPLAEREGLIDDLFWLIFSKACHKALRHDETVSLAINVSARQLQSETFPARLLGTIERFGMSPSQFEVEVTETAMIANEKLADTALRQLAGAGLSIALDDFGTGFSSLSLLHKFSFSKLKIDHSFVRRMTQDARSRDIVESTILMADRLGLQTVAEGVEDQETLEFLHRIGCDLVQGFHLASPQPEFHAEPRGERLTAVA